MKEFRQLLKALQDQGFNVELKQRHKLTVQIRPPNHIQAQMYIAHYGASAVVPVRQWARNKCGVTI